MAQPPSSLSPESPEARALIDALGLEPHVEGGYFRRTYTAPGQVIPDEAGPRPTLTVIHYLLTAANPIGHLHRNRADIVHFHQAGGTLEYLLLDGAVALRRVRLGPGWSAGEQLQLTVPGGVWKATRLVAGPYALISEAVTPGFVYADMELATPPWLASLPPGPREILRPYLHPDRQ